MSDLRLSFPSLDIPLHQLDHPLVKKAQELPQVVSSGGGKRIRVVQDRVWFKVKTTDHRGAATQLSEDDHPADMIRATESWWWLGRGGRRRDDSEDDFYRQLESETVRQGRGSGSTASSHLLPQTADVNRLELETLYQATISIGRVVRTLVAKSLRDGKQWTAEISDYTISAQVRSKDGDAYLAIRTDGIPNPKFVAVILRSVPGVASEDWLPEPGGALGVEPGYGSIVYSTILPTEAQTAVLDHVPELD